MRPLILTVVIALFSSVAFCQTSSDIGEQSDWKDRIYIGGNLGLQFGTITNIEVSPLIGYRFTNTFSAGVGITYIYFKRDYDPPIPDYETNIYGGRIFARKSITQQFFLHGEYESLNWEFYDTDSNLRREWVPGLFLGGGFFQPIGRNAGFSAMALYNVIYDDFKSPYNSPLVIRVGVAVGF